MSRKDSKIVVVGGGISGLSALKTLSKNGFENTVLLEASSRLGGRISTQSYGNHVLEIGAQWIHGQDDNPVYEMAKKHDLAYVDNRRNESADNDSSDDESLSDDDEDDHFYMTNGKRVSQDLADETCLLLDNIFCEGNKFSRQNIPINKEDESIGTFAHEEFYKYLRTSGKSEEEKHIMEAIFHWRCLAEKIDNACTSIYELSLYAWGQYLECPGNNYVPLKRGFERVIDVIKEGIPTDKIKLNTPVQCIYWHEDAIRNSYKNGGQRSGLNLVPNDEEFRTFRSLAQCEPTFQNDVIPNTQHSTPPIVIKTAHGDVIEADHVIVTCSLGYLKKYAPTLFKPLLPYDKMAAIQRMGFGTVDKIYIEFEKPFWDKDCAGIQFAWLPEEHFVLNCLENKYVDEYGNWWKDLHGFDTVQFHPNLLCGWIAGEDANVMERIPENVVLDVCHELLQRFTANPDIPKPVKITRSKWYSEPYVLGSYSFIKLGSTGSDCDVLAQPLLSKQVPRVLFAGEATHKAYFSTTHGALISGQREAQRLIDLYNLE